jgi:hypothetical protein
MVWLRDVSFWIVSYVEEVVLPVEEFWAQI